MRSQQLSARLAAMHAMQDRTNLPGGGTKTFQRRSKPAAPAKQVSSEDEDEQFCQAADSQEQEHGGYGWLGLSRRRRTSCMLAPLQPSNDPHAAARAQRQRRREASKPERQRAEALQAMIQQMSLHFQEVDAYELMEESPVAKTQPHHSSRASLHKARVRYGTSESNAAPAPQPRQSLPTWQESPECTLYSASDVSGSGSMVHVPACAPTPGSTDAAMHAAAAFSMERARRSAANAVEASAQQAAVSESAGRRSSVHSMVSTGRDASQVMVTIQETGRASALDGALGSGLHASGAHRHSTCSWEGPASTLPTPHQSALGPASPLLPSKSPQYQERVTPPEFPDVQAMAVSPVPGILSHNTASQGGNILFRQAGEAALFASNEPTFLADQPASPARAEDGPIPRGNASDARSASGAGSASGASTASQLSGSEASSEADSPEPLTPLQQLLAICEQDVDVSSIPSMEDLLSCTGELRRMVKVGEGSYGEAFRQGSMVVKIIPIEGQRQVNGYPQRKAGDMTGEALVSLAVSGLRRAQDAGGNPCPNMAPCFVNTSKVAVCHGPYPRLLAKAWHKWDEEHGSENDPVDGPGWGHGSTAARSQLYLVLSMEDAGRDLEKYTLRKGMDEAKAILVQAAFALAVGEAALQFEHRDLHWGNLLLRPALTSTLSFRLQGQEYKVKTHGVHASLIDFTASRLVSEGGRLAFCDLSQDPEIFQGPQGQVQFDTYREMQQLTGDQWDGPCLRTNCLWVAYLAEVLAAEKIKGQGAVAHKRLLREFRQRCGAYSCCMEMVVQDELFKGLWSQADS